MSASLSLAEIVEDFAKAFKAVDTSAPQGRSRNRVYHPGIGPLTEAEAVKQALSLLRSWGELYKSASPSAYPGSRQLCDLVIPGYWAIEFKLIRPYGDNGLEAEHWSENILHPYPGNISSVGDCIKLRQSNFPERKAIVVFGYEHSPAVIELEVASEAFERVAQDVAGPRYGFAIGDRNTATFEDLIHPYHQQGKVFGWEVLSAREPGR